VITHHKNIVFDMPVGPDENLRLSWLSVGGDEIGYFGGIPRKGRTKVAAVLAH
jgi:hypothetical protein